MNGKSEHVILGVDVKNCRPSLIYFFDSFFSSGIPEFDAYAIQSVPFNFFSACFYG